MASLLKRVKISGSGEPVLILHGMGGPQVLDDLEKFLSQKQMIIKPTMYGFLAEDNIINYSDNYYMDFIEKLRMELKIEKWVVLGLSMGGRTAINYTIRYENRVEKLILLNSVGIGYMNPLFRFKPFKKLFSTLIYTVLKYRPFQDALGKADFVDTTSSVYINARDGVAALLENKLVRRNFANILVNIGCPIIDLKGNLKALQTDTLILWAKDDKTAPIKWAHELKNEISNSKIFILDSYKHMALLEAPQFYTDNILAFLQSIDGTL